MAKKVKIIYFVTMVIKYSESVEDKLGIPRSIEKITIFQKTQKLAKNEMESYNKTLIEAQQRFPRMRMMAYSITELVATMFDVTEADELADEKIKEAQLKIEKDSEG